MPIADVLLHSSETTLWATTRLGVDFLKARLSGGRCAAYRECRNQRTLSSKEVAIKARQSALPGEDGFNVVIEKSKQLGRDDAIDDFPCCPV